MKHCWYSFTYVVSVLTFQDTPRLIIVEVLTHSTAWIPFGNTNNIVEEFTTHHLAWTPRTLPVYIECFDTYRTIWQRFQHIPGIVVESLTHNFALEHLKPCWHSFTCCHNNLTLPNYTQGYSGRGSNPFHWLNNIVVESSTHCLAWTLETLPVHIEVFDTTGLYGEGSNTFHSLNTIWRDKWHCCGITGHHIG